MSRQYSNDVTAVQTDLTAVRTDLASVQASVDALDAKIEGVEAEMVTKTELHRENAASEARMEQRLQNAILEAKISLIKWMIATMTVFSGIVIGAMTALQ